MLLSCFVETLISKIVFKSSFKPLFGVYISMCLLILCSIFTKCGRTVLLVVKDILHSYCYWIIGHHYFLFSAILNALWPFNTNNMWLFSAMLFFHITFSLTFHFGESRRHCKYFWYQLFSQWHHYDFYHCNNWQIPWWLISNKSQYFIKRRNQ